MQAIGRRVLWNAALVVLAFALTEPARAQSTPVPTFKVLHTFASAEMPFGPLVQGLDGSFYGILQAGGIYSQGAIFKIDANGTYSLLYSFGTSSTAAIPPDGSFPPRV